MTKTSSKDVDNTIEMFFESQIHDLTNEIFDLLESPGYKSTDTSNKSLLILDLFYKKLKWCEYEVKRLRAGLYDLRFGDYWQSIDAVNKFMDNLLKIEILGGE